MWVRVGFFVSAGAVVSACWSLACTGVGGGLGWTGCGGACSAGVGLRVRYSCSRHVLGATCLSDSVLATHSAKGKDFCLRSKRLRTDGIPRVVAPAIVPLFSTRPPIRRNRRFGQADPPRRSR